MIRQKNFRSIVRNLGVYPGAIPPGGVSIDGEVSHIRALPQRNHSVTIANRFQAGGLGRPRADRREARGAPRPATQTEPPPQGAGGRGRGGARVGGGGGAGGATTGRPARGAGRKKGKAPAQRSAPTAQRSAPTAPPRELTASRPRPQGEGEQCGMPRQFRPSMVEEGVRQKNPHNTLWGIQGKAVHFYMTMRGKLFGKQWWIQVYPPKFTR